MSAERTSYRRYLLGQMFGAAAVAACSSVVPAQEPEAVG
jgi:hypothetical protein